METYVQKQKRVLGPVNYHFFIVLLERGFELLKEKEAKLYEIWQKI
jgi:hypothetical protein